MRPVPFCGPFGYARFESCSLCLGVSVVNADSNNMFISFHSSMAGIHALGSMSDGPFMLVGTPLGTTDGVYRLQPDKHTSWLQSPLCTWWSQRYPPGLLPPLRTHGPPVSQKSVRV